MAQTEITRIEFFASGYCEAHNFFVTKSGGFSKTSFYAVWCLLDIPTIGYVMFDTGYSKHFEQATTAFPEKLYKWATPMFLKEEESAIEQLKKRNINHHQIKYIIVSHFHADHIAGLHDFPNAKIICTKEAFEQVQLLNGFSAVKKGIIHKLLPKDISSRILLIEDINTKYYIDAYGLEHMQVFNCEDFTLVRLNGHAKGMLGLLINNKDSKLFYACDAAWSKDAFDKNILPHFAVKLFFDSWNEFKKTITKIKHFEKENKETTILFTHCKKTLKYLSHEI